MEQAKGPDVANVLLNLGGMYEEQAFYGEAETRYRCAADIMAALPTGEAEKYYRLTRALENPSIKSITSSLVFIEGRGPAMRRSGDFIAGFYELPSQPRTKLGKCLEAQKIRPAHLVHADRPLKSPGGLKLKPCKVSDTWICKGSYRLLSVPSLVCDVP